MPYPNYMIYSSKAKRVLNLRHVRGTNISFLFALDLISQIFKANLTNTFDSQLMHAKWHSHMCVLVYVLVCVYVHVCRCTCIYNTI